MVLNTKIKDKPSLLVMKRCENVNIVTKDNMGGKSRRTDKL